MNYTPEDLRAASEGCKDFIPETATMLRAGADAMEREKQARNQALEKAAEIADRRVDRLKDVSLEAAMAMLVALPDAIRALKGDTINGEKLTEDDLQFFLDQDNQGEPQ